MRSWSLALGCGVVLLGAGPADARCDDDRDFRRVASATRGALHCEGRLLRGGSARCTPRAPTCAAAAADDLRQLVYGAAPSHRVRRSDAHRCQAAIDRATQRYVARRVDQRLRGRRAAPRARLLRRVLGPCDGVAIERTDGGRLPAVAGACGPLLESAAVVDGDALGRCLSAAAEGILDRAAPAPMAPNILLVYTDDQRWDTLGAMPATLDRLADRGTVFRNAFVTTPVCGPSRASLLTGRYAHAHGIRTNLGLLHPANDFDEDDTVGRWLEAADYRTAFLGKYVNGTNFRPEGAPRGWTSWQTFRIARYHDYELDVDGRIEAFGATPADYSTDVLTGRALDFVERHRREPFFVVLSLFAPHSPATPAERHVGIHAALPPWRPVNHREEDVSDKPPWVRFMQRVTSTPPDADDAFRIRQLESLAAVDEAVARLSDRLDDLGLTDNTVVVFTSDNGYHWGEHWWSSKFTGYEESLRVPLLVRHPAVQPLPRTSDALVLNLDLAPTFAELAGAAPASNVDGRSLAPLLRGESWQRTDFLFEIFDRVLMRPHAGVRSTDHKYIDTQDGRFEELYDLDADPGEIFNRAFDPAWRDLLDLLRGRLHALRR